MVDFREHAGALQRRAGHPAAQHNGRDTEMGGAATGDELLVAVRGLSEADIPWLHDLCSRKYNYRYDAIASEQWFRNQVFKNSVLYCAVRTDNAFCITFLTVPVWFPGEYEANVLFICAEDGAHWEAMRLLRFSIDWSRIRKCTTWRLACDTAVDLGPFAMRLGATESWPRYMVRF